MILITGGNSPLGGAIAKVLAPRPLLLHDRGLADFSSDESLDHFLESYQKEHPSTFGLVHVVGPYLGGAWKEVFQQNFFAQVTIIERLLPSIQQAQGRIVIIGTVGIGRYRPFHDKPKYQIAKATLWNYCLTLAKEMLPHGVTVNMVSPGVMPNSEDYRELPPTEFREVADVVAYLFDNSAITGQNIEVSRNLLF